MPGASSETNQEQTPQKEQAAPESGGAKFIPSDVKDAMAVPQKYQGKSAEELIRILEDKEKFEGKRSQEIGDLRKKAAETETLKQERDQYANQYQQALSYFQEQGRGSRNVKEDQGASDYFQSLADLALTDPTRYNQVLLSGINQMVQNQAQNLTAPLMKEISADRADAFDTKYTKAVEMDERLLSLKSQLAKNGNNKQAEDIVSKIKDVAKRDRYYKNAINGIRGGMKLGEVRDLMGDEYDLAKQSVTLAINEILQSDLSPLLAAEAHRDNVSAGQNNLLAMGAIGSGNGQYRPGSNSAHNLTAEEQFIIRNMGITPEAYLKFKSLKGAR